MCCPQIKFWYTLTQVNLWDWLVMHPMLELEQSCFIAIRTEATAQLPTVTPTAAERNYGQTHKEAVAIIFGLRKFYEFLYGLHFILVTDRKPMTSFFGPKKEKPLLAANRLARWALWLN